MSGKSKVISDLLFLRKQYKTRFDDQISLGSNWSITTDSDNALRIKHTTGGADVKIDDLGSVSTTGSVGTRSGITIGGDDLTYISEYTVTEIGHTLRSEFAVVQNHVLTQPSTNNATIQYYDAAASGDYYVWTENVPATNDMIYVLQRGANVAYGQLVTLNPVGSALSVKVNGLAMDHAGTSFATLLALQYNIGGVPTWGTYLRVYTLLNTQWVVTTEVVVDSAAQHVTTQFMFSNSGQYMCIGIPSYNGGVGGILVYSVDLAGMWSLVDTVFPSAGGTHVGFGSTAFISDDGQTILGRHSFGGAPDAKARVYVFKKLSTSWMQNATIEEPTGNSVDTLFGTRAAVSSDGNTIFASDEAWNTNTGRVMIYTRDTHTGSWSMLQQLTAAGLVSGDRFGNSFESRGKYIAIAAPKPGANVIYMFARTNDLWSESDTLTNAAVAFNGPFHMKLCRYEILFTAQIGTGSPAIQMYQALNTFSDAPMHTHTILPNTNNAYDFGALTLAWRDIYIVNAATVTSSEMKKTDIQQCRLGVDFIRDLNPITFNWKYDTDLDDHDGFIAQDVQSSISDDSIVVAGAILGMRSNEIIAPLTTAIHNLDGRLSKLEAIL
jgi:hypothetical protein